MWAGTVADRLTGGCARPEDWEWRDGTAKETKTTSDHHLISPQNINTKTNIQIKRIQKRIIKGFLYCYNIIKKILPTSIIRNVWRPVRRICMLTTKWPVIEWSILLFLFRVTTQLWYIPIDRPATNYLTNWQHFFMVYTLIDHNSWPMSAQEIWQLL